CACANTRACVSSRYTSRTSGCTLSTFDHNTDADARTCDANTCNASSGCNSDTSTRCSASNLQ
ncbi:MAG: hypothetical protein Q7T03_03675, partial [Deltaproteobacteria bacterium]|nr:hypothetical protein [Deltaproteobacteria bacterium]